MSDYDWNYIIENVVSKNQARRGRYHHLIIGKRCIVPDNQPLPYCIGSMIIEPFGRYPSPRWFHTTIFQQFDKMENGRVIMETENSIYTFVPIQKE